ncbi:PP2C family protein-serine/threonine phosphatase [Chitinivibrio alkaliphilus]|uniref:Serine/threonine phosphatase, family 2C n=1 Tax=Chitinivibrio alkaliphilus ACht1 TaxID=1313304 RepID=U7DCU9_9BACT|nr:PP2C family protein-serine/threonine phosphatase [Chitinivibrio alkaliphilus]ERP38726.1 Serine/threonine phosphatase, family 2C [Chitinivibrio alkaliphilus ACht1]
MEHGEYQAIIDELQHENARLQQDLMASTIITRFTELLYGVTTIDEVLGILLYSISDVVSLDKIAYFALDAQRYGLRLDRSMGFSPQEEHALSRVFFSIEECDSDLRKSLFEGTPLHVEQVQEEDNVLARVFHANSFLVFPLLRDLSQKDQLKARLTACSSQMERERCERRLLQRGTVPTLGFFWLDTSGAEGEHLDQDIANLSVYVQTASIIIDNILMINQLRDINRRNKEEQEQARRVQQALLPSNVPCEEGFQAAARYIPQEEIGGDYYDIFEVAPGVYDVIIADVSGHGTSSALVMGMVKVLLRQYADPNLGPAEVFRRINNVLVSHVPSGKFVTAFYGRIYVHTREIVFTSAGHCPVYLLDTRRNTVSELSSCGTFLGMFPDLGIRDVSLSYAYGESRLFLYTDGMSEAFNREKIPFGIERIVSTLKKYRHEAPGDSLEHMLKEMELFVGAVPLTDDVTLCMIDL